MTILNHTLGFPRVGLRRELKKAQESYWAGNSTQEELLATGRELRARHWKQQTEAGVDVVPDGYLYLRERTGKVCNYMPLSMLHQKRAQLINTDTVYFDNYKIDMDNSFIRFNVAYDSVAVTFFYNE